MSQLHELSKPFSGKYVQRAPKGKYGDYVSHSTINERLLQAVGPFTFEVVEVVRGYAEEIKTSKNTFPARENAVVGVIARLTVTIDGRTVSIEEVGAEDSPAMKGDGDNLKMAMSDALKRCAMRLGLGLHLWSGELYFLDRALERTAPPAKAAAPARAAPAKPNLEAAADVAEAALEEMVDEVVADADEFPPEPPQPLFDASTAKPSDVSKIGAALKPLKLSKEQARALVESVAEREISTITDLTLEEGENLAELTTDQWSTALDAMRVPA